MVTLKIPTRLNGTTFYGEVLPSIYENIIKGDYEINFDMHRTELANPEGLVNLLASAAMIFSKSKHTPTLYFPESPNLFEYMRKSGFFKWATVNKCLKFNFFDDILNDAYENSNYFRPQLYGLYIQSNDARYEHYKHVKGFVIAIANYLAEDKVDLLEINRYCDQLLLSLDQVIKNSLEHNNGYIGTLAYYMMQKTPYNTIELAFSDIGQGILERMKKMLKEKDHEAVNKYGYLEQKLNNKDLLFEEDCNNPNLLAITNAVKYREDSEIPGLHKIKEFALKYGGLFSIHSGNYTVRYSGNNIKTLFHRDSYFSGCHLKIVMNLPKTNNQ